MYEIRYLDKDYFKQGKYICIHYDKINNQMSYQKLKNKHTILQNASKFPNKKFGLGPGIPIFSKICILPFLCLQMENITWCKMMQIHVCEHKDWMKYKYIKLHNSSQALIKNNILISIHKLEIYIIILTNGDYARNTI